MRQRRSAKQHLWLGPGRYRSRCRNALTNRNSYSNGNSHRYTRCMFGGNSDSDAYADRYSGTMQLVRRPEHAYGFD